MINHTMITPLGAGTYQGVFADGRALVRLPVNDLTEKHLKADNCLTPRASKSGLWLFDKSEVKV